jgi:hypothetical protein
MNERIWIFTVSRTLSREDIRSLAETCSVFVNSWTAHEQKLNATFELYKERLLIFRVDEGLYNASGCSIDKLMHLVQGLEKTFSIELLNRLLVVYEDKEQLEVVNSSQIKLLLQKGTINENTLIYDNTISMSRELSGWKKPLKETWLNKFLPSFTS